MSVNTSCCQAIRVVSLALGLTMTAEPAAKADVVVSAILIKNPSAGAPFEGPESTLGSPWVSYALQVQSTAPGGEIQTILAEISGPLHQRWTDVDGNGTFEATPNLLDTSEGDSHLSGGPGVLWGVGPIEDNSASGSPLISTVSDSYGIGNTLSGAWAIPNGTNSATVAYLVIPRGREAELDIVVKLAFVPGPLYESIVEFDEDDFFPAVPEPNSALLLFLSLASWGFTRWPRKEYFQSLVR